MNERLLTVSLSPHVFSRESVRSLMCAVIIALAPAWLVSIAVFGLPALRVTSVAVFSCVLFEYLITRFALKCPATVADGSAVITGLLLAFNLPSSMPGWMVAAGSLVAITVAKMTFGGLGNNPFNPALIGRVFLLASFPVEMTSWPRPLLGLTPDVITSATPLSLVKEGVKMGKGLSALAPELPSHLDLFVGKVGGSLGEVSALALIIGGLYLLYRRVITWHIPVSMLGAVAAFTGILWAVNPDKYASPLFHLFSGGLMLGAFFMATDLVTSPMTATGMLIFGTCAGILTVVIRVFGAYPEGVSFAILIMNAFVPLINRYCKPRRFGE